MQINAVVPCMFAAVERGQDYVACNKPTSFMEHIIFFRVTAVVEEYICTVSFCFKESLHICEVNSSKIHKY